MFEDTFEKNYVVVNGQRYIDFDTMAKAHEKHRSPCFVMFHNLRNELEKGVDYVKLTNKECYLNEGTYEHTANGQDKKVFIGMKAYLLMIGTARDEKSKQVRRFLIDNFLENIA